MHTIGSFCQRPNGPLAYLLTDYQRSERLLSKLRHRLPQPLGEHLCSLHFDSRERRLLIHVDGQVWITRLRFLSSWISAFWVAEMGQQLALQRIEFRVYYPLPTTGKAVSAPLPLSKETRTLLQELAETLQHPPLQNAVRRLAEADVEEENEAVYSGKEWL